MRFVLIVLFVLLLSSSALADVRSEFKQRSKAVGGRSADIFSKDLIKRPNKYTGEQLTFVGKIAKIEEDEGETLIQTFINRDYDLVMVYLSGSVDFYDGDIVRIYGTARGVMDGVNGFGAPMQWPLIEAFIVEANE